jgi:archaeosine-15-forming tRNA-guanine transglycosylase
VVRRRLDNCFKIFIEIIQDKIKSFFPSYRVIVPEDAELAVLKGAVLFGHKPDYIVARIARYTYGVECQEDFVKF